MNNRCFGRQIQAETADLGASLIRTLELLPQVIVDAEALAGAIEGGAGLRRIGGRAVWAGATGV